MNGSILVQRSNAKHAPHCPQVRLLAVATGRTVFRHELEAGEVPLTARGVHLADKSPSGKKTRPLVAVGTSFSAGATPFCVHMWPA